MTPIEPGIKLIYNGKELMLPGTTLTVKKIQTYNVDGVFETMVVFEETGESEYNIRFFTPDGAIPRYLGQFHGIHPDFDRSKIPNLDKDTP